MNLNTVKSNLSDLASSTLDHVTDTLQHGQKDVSRTASKVMHSDAVTTVSDKLTTLGKVIAAAGSAKAISKALNPDVPMQWMLGALNLQRRPSAFSRIATGVGLVAAGAAVGAGVALLLTPKTGPQNRAALRRGMLGLRRDAEQAAGQVETRVHEVVGKVENRVHDVVGQVENRVHEVVGKAEHRAQDAVQAVQDGTRIVTDESAKGGGGTPAARPRTPGLSHRFPRE